VAIVWPCPLPVDAYVAAGRQVEFPRPDCPSCAGPLVFWSGYRRHVRVAGRCRRIFVPRLRCGRCRVTHALLPAFVLAWRLDRAETLAGTRRLKAWPGAVILGPPGLGIQPATAHHHGTSPARRRITMLVAFSVTPLGVGEAVTEYVADAVRVVRDSGLPNRTDAMFTTVEGDWDEVMDVVKRAVEAVAAKAPRVSLTLKADVRPGVTGALESKVETLERYLGT
jgi:uncharacterized protein (TIGR00106 family)